MVTNEPVDGKPPRGEVRGFRPGSRRRARIAAGAALAAAAVGGNVLVYASLNDTTEVLQVVRNVRAGETLTSADLRVVEVDLDPTVPTVAADDIGLVANQYARVYIASGTLIVPQLVQPDPLVTESMAVVAIQITPERMPFGLRERSRVRLVVPPSGSDGERFETDGRVVYRGEASDGVTGDFALSIELPEADAAIIAASDDVEVILLPQTPDPARTEGDEG